MPRSAPRPAVPSLRCNDLLFLNEYLANGRNGVQAYRTVHPKASYHVAGQRASIVLKKGVVQAELTRRIQHEGGITRELVESDLLTARQWALDNHAPLELASIAVDCAKLAGFWVEKREQRTLTDEQSSAIRSLVHASLTPTRSGISKECLTSDVMLNTPSPTPSALNGN